MIYAFALLVVASFSFLIIRTGALALELTGLSRDASRFQALSAFFGVGFTTREAEFVVNHPVRRKIISYIIVIGNIGTLSAIGTIIVGAGKLDFEEHHLQSWGIVGLVAVGLLALWALARTHSVNSVIRWTVARTLAPTHSIHAMDYEELLRVRSGYEVVEIILDPVHPCVGRPLEESRPRDDGVTVLGITHVDGEFIGAPGPSSRPEAGDTLILYGQKADIDRFAQAGKGESAPAPPQPVGAEGVHSSS